MSKVKNKTTPSKCTITMGGKLTQTNYTGDISGIDLINAVILLMKDTQKMTGMQYKEIFAIIDDCLDAEVFKKKPTMRASLSELGDKD